MMGRIMMAKESLLSDAPDWVRWIMGFIERIGFPIAVTVYLAYMQFNILNKVSDALGTFNNTMVQMRTAIEENTKAINKGRWSRER